MRWNAFLIGVLLAAAACSRSPEPVVLQAGEALEERDPLPDFSLVDAAGRPANRKFFEGRWSVVFGGYTHCPDICPLTAALFAELDGRLRKRGDRVQFVFLSVDPARDSPELLGRYLAHFDPDIRGLTGKPSEVERLAHGLGFAQVKNPGTRGDYTVDHSAAFVLVDPDGQVAGWFRPPYSVNRLEADLAPLAAQAH